MVGKLGTNNTNDNGGGNREGKIAHPAIRRWGALKDDDHVSTIARYCQKQGRR